MALRLPGSISAWLFDLDDVLTRTATLHAAAWKQTSTSTSSGVRRSWAARFVPFDAVTDYDDDVPGRFRLEGARALLASRGIELPEGTVEHGAEARRCVSSRTARTSYSSSSWKRAASRCAPA